jgi:HD-like signal output (HDOD) protein
MTPPQNAALEEMQKARSADAMRFVQELAVAVSGPPLELPSYPEVAMRVQRILSDPNASASRVVKVIGSDPMLASRVVNMANSAAMNRSDNPATDLQEAVARVGFDALRSAAIGFAMTQLRKATAFRDIEKPLTVLWQHSVACAAMCYVLAKKLRRVAPDMAMLAGLVSDVGKIYILTKAGQYPALFADQSTYQDVVREWHPQVARSVLENWSMPEEIVEAVGGFEEAAEDHSARSPLTDIISVAVTLVELRDSPDLLSARLAQHRGALRLQLTPTAVGELMVESTGEVASLRDALGR